MAAAGGKWSKSGKFIPAAGSTAVEKERPYYRASPTRIGASRLSDKQLRETRNALYKAMSNAKSSRDRAYINGKILKLNREFSLRLMRSS